MYKINPSVYQDVFVMPRNLIENHLILAGEIQLKVLIYAFSAPGKSVSAKEAAEFLKIPENEAADALLYWAERGIITDENSAPELITSPVKPEEKQKKEPEKKPAKNSPGRFTYNEICQRINESEEVRALFSEAQVKLGRTIGTADQSSLLMLLDYYALPLEVILSICEYARLHGKNKSMNYIYTVGVDWSTREIDTIEKADEEFRKIERNEGAWTQFCALSGVKPSTATSKKLKYFYIWINEWHFSMPMILSAYEEMENHTDSTSFNYMNTILSGWRDKGIKTPEQAAEDKKEFMKQQEEKALKRQQKKTKPAAKKASVSDGPKASYDIDSAENKAKTSVPALKKRGT